MAALLYAALLPTFPTAASPLSSSSSKTLLPLRQPLPPPTLRRQLSAPAASSSFTTTTKTGYIGDFDWDSLPGTDSGSGVGFSAPEECPPEEDSPWLGAVVYRRDASVTHVEFCTTLERLGMKTKSTRVSRRKAAEMGLRIVAKPGAPLDPSLAGGTPVLVSIDVARKKKGKLILHGIIRTVLGLPCNRCGVPAGKTIFSNFTLLLSREPIKKPDNLDMGSLYGDDVSRASSWNCNEEDEDDDEKLIDFEDRLHFPVEENEIDISKHIRDIVHIEITINALCQPGCKGICFKCGADLNWKTCGCKMEQSANSPFEPLKDQLREKFQR